MLTFPDQPNYNCYFVDILPLINVTQPITLLNCSKPKTVQIQPNRVGAGGGGEGEKKKRQFNHPIIFSLLEHNH